MKTKMYKGLLFFILFESTATAQHLNYKDNKNGDIIMNEVMVTNTTPCSYWETMGWNVGGQGGAYCGIQQQSGYTNMIFSIWDPIGTTRPITASYSLPNSLVQNFGGEGTGLHYDDRGLIGWKLNTWVRVVSRRWDYNGDSYFGMWTYDYGTNKWTHHITMDFPVASVQFNSGGSNSFLEDWCGSPQNYRKGLFKNGYKRTSTGWMPYNTASYGGNSTASSDKLANAGVENGAYFMEFGGNTIKTVTNGQNLSISIPAKPILTIGQILSTSISYKLDSLQVAWVTDIANSPQFSYTIKVINGVGLTVMTKTDIVPHLRKLTFNVKSLAAGTYTVNVSMLDIFDQMSNEITKTVVIGGATNVNDQIAYTNDFMMYPNPCNNLAYLYFNNSEVHEARIFIYDVVGHSVLSDLMVTSDKNMLDVSGLSNGIYFMNVCDKNKNILQHIKIIKSL
jgi:hypothetical protein